MTEAQPDVVIVERMRSGYVDKVDVRVFNEGFVGSEGFGESESSCKCSGFPVLSRSDCLCFRFGHSVYCSGHFFCYVSRSYDTDSEHVCLFDDV